MKGVVEALKLPNGPTKRKLVSAEVIRTCPAGTTAKGPVSRHQKAKGKICIMFAFLAFCAGAVSVAGVTVTVIVVVVGCWLFCVVIVCCLFLVVVLCLLLPLPLL